jgi:hypothetical protein
LYVQRVPRLEIAQNFSAFAANIQRDAGKRHQSWLDPGDRTLDCHGDEDAGVGQPHHREHRVVGLDSPMRSKDALVGRREPELGKHHDHDGQKGHQGNGESERSRPSSRQLHVTSELDQILDRRTTTMWTRRPPTRVRVAIRPSREARD